MSRLPKAALFRPLPCALEGKTVALTGRWRREERSLAADHGLKTDDRVRIHYPASPQSHASANQYVSRVFLPIVE